MSEEKKENLELGPIDKLFDENNTDPIVLYSEKGEKLSFEQIALIPVEERIFAILKPIEKTDGVKDDEALVFEVVQPENDDEEEYLNLVADIDMIDKVFKVYNKLIDEEIEKNKDNKKGNK